LEVEVDPTLKSTLLKLALPVGLIAFLLAVTRIRGLRWREDLRLLWPSPRTTALWVGGWLVWIAAGELATRALHLETVRPWPAYPLGIVVLRIVIIGILGPISEELVFRGVLFRPLLAKVGPALTILLTSLVFGLSHYGYEWAVMAFVCADGVFFGLARHRSGSVCLPMLLHSIGNLISIAQSLA
jgi:membrane protease YdiL (CAAX protease family)